MVSTVPLNPPPTPARPTAKSLGESVVWESRLAGLGAGLVLLRRRESVGNTAWEHLKENT